MPEIPASHRDLLDGDFATLSKLKTERDALSRAIAAGEWVVH